MNRTDKILTRFDEKFIKGFQNVIGYTAVYVNPTLQEFKSLETNEVRFMTDSANKNIYVWNARSALHHEVRDAIKLKVNRRDDIWGEASKKGNTYHIYTMNVTTNDGDYFHVSSFDFRPADELVEGEAIVDTYLSKNWKWAEKWIKGITKFLNEKLKV